MRKASGGMSGSDTTRTFADGERIVAEGDSGREMYIVASGRVRITKRQGAHEVELDVVERGDFFGEMALLESLPRFASAYAIGETRLVSIEPGGLLLRIRRDPTLAIEMLNRLSSRLRKANTRLIEGFDEAAVLDAPGPTADGAP